MALARVSATDCGKKIPGHRLAHPGYTCPSRVADGEKVGRIYEVGMLGQRASGTSTPEAFSLFLPFPVRAATQISTAKVGSEGNPADRCEYTQIGSVPGMPAYAARSDNLELCGGRKQPSRRAHEIVRVRGCNRIRRCRRVWKESGRADQDGSEGAKSTPPD